MFSSVLKALGGGLLFGSLLKGIMGGGATMPKAPPVPDVADASASIDADRERRRRLAAGGRGSTFLTGSGGVSDMGAVRRGSDFLNPMGAR